MLEADKVRKLAKRSEFCGKRKIAAEKRASDRSLTSVRREALKKVGEYTQQCLKEVRKAARAQGLRTRSVDVDICHFFEEKGWELIQCHEDAAKKVLKNLIQEGFSAEMRFRDNHGHHNSQEVYEYHYMITIKIGW